MNAVKYINQLGYTIPKDIALVCFDESDAFDLFYAPLTCIQQPIKEMGEIAVKMLLENISNNDSGLHQVSLEGKLLVRASTARSNV